MSVADPLIVDTVHRILEAHCTPELINAAEDVYRTLVMESREDRIHNPGLEEARADVIVGGMCVLVRIMRYFDIEELVVSESDILDGLVFSLLD